MKFHIPSPLREFTGGRSTVEIDDSPATVTEALSALWKCYPGLRDRIATEQGQIREHINVFVGDENIQFTGGLATPVGKGSEISIVPNISGGSHFEPIRKLSADYNRLLRFFAGVEKPRSIQKKKSA
ncbi:MAG TPA: ubiquitin-like small modifier protein 1 [Pyrinomonadaceae bacterium]|jgi:molybdopterin converting factor small subunit